MKFQPSVAIAFHLSQLSLVACMWSDTCSEVTVCVLLTVLSGVVLCVTTLLTMVGWVALLVRDTDRLKFAGILPKVLSHYLC